MVSKIKMVLRLKFIINVMNIFIRIKFFPINDPLRVLAI